MKFAILNNDKIVINLIEIEHAISEWGGNDAVFCGDLFVDIGFYFDGERFLKL